MVDGKSEMVAEQVVIGTVPFERQATKIILRGYTFHKIGATVYNSCTKCAGVGNLQQHSNVYNGVCFTCDGTGRGRAVKGGVASLDAITKRRERSQRTRDAKRDAKRAQQAEAAGLRWQQQLNELHDEAIEIDKARSAQRYAGDVGQTITANVTVVVARLIETRFGLSRLIIATDGNGSTIKIFSSGKSAMGISPGDTITITGRVKAHEEYEGTKQTLIARPKITSS